MTSFVTFLDERLRAVCAQVGLDNIVYHQVVFHAAFLDELLPTAFELTKQYLAIAACLFMKLLKTIVARQLLDKLYILLNQYLCNIESAFVA